MSLGNSRRPSFRERAREIAQAAGDVEADPELVAQVAPAFLAYWAELPEAAEVDDEALRKYAEQAARIQVQGALSSGASSLDEILDVDPVYARESLLVSLETRRLHVSMLEAVLARWERLDAMLVEWHAMGKEGRWSRAGNELCGKMLVLAGELDAAVRAYEGKYPIHAELQAALDEHITPALDYLIGDPELRDIWKEEVERFAEEDRAARIEQRRTQRVEPVIVERKCSSCKRKPARVDDLCKKCAHAAGTLARGKIGEG